MNRALSIAIVGCGVGGLALATLLARQGHQVVAFDKARPLGPVGAGLLIQPSGAAVLSRLGVLDEIRASAAPVHRLLGRSTRGRHVLDLHYRDLHPQVHGLGTHRGTLFRTLSSVVEQAGVQSQQGVDVRHIHSDGRHVIDGAGTTHGPFDLIAVADGARSSLRRVIAPWARERVYEWGAAWCVVEERPRPFQDTLFQVYSGTRRMLGLLPTGTPTPGGPRTVAMFWSIRMRSIDEWRTQGIDAWRREALALMPEAAPLLEQVRSLDQFVPAVYVDALASPCFSGRAVLLGDAAHAMSPQLGQGANLALCDAQALAESLEQCADVPTALASFEHRRRGSWNTYARLTRWLTPVFQSSINLLGPPRDLCFPWMCRFPPTRRMMLDSLGGMKTGTFTTAPLPCEALSVN